MTLAAVGAHPELDDPAAALGLLAAYGIPIPELRTLGDEEALADAADYIGYPLVLKTAESIDHKTEVGGVVVGIDDLAAALEAYRDLSSRLGSRVLVMEQVPDGVEIGLGMVTDEQFGPVIILSAGGTMIEVMADRVALFPRVDKERALRALDRLRIRPLLDGVRGGQPVDRDAIAEIIARFSELVSDSAGLIRAIDVNPVIAGPGGSVAVDAVMKGR